jgi:hypothetical protein
MQHVKRKQYTIHASFGPGAKLPKHGQQFSVGGVLTRFDWTLFGGGAR